jgi:hypothetical protein
MFSWRCFPFVESAPRAYRLKASNAAPLSSTSAGTFPRIWRADTYQFAGKIKDSMFHFQFGSEGEANSGTYDGKIGVDGSAEINVKGLTGDPAYDPLHRPLGTGYHYKIAIKLDEARGAGIRIETPRPCRSEWSKLSPLTTVTPTPDSNAPASPAACFGNFRTPISVIRGQRFQ